MKINSIWKFTAAAAFLFAMDACSNSASPDDDEYDDIPTTTSSNSTKRSSSSAAGTISCSMLKESLSAPTNFAVTKDTDSSWTLSWDYVRNDSRGESGFEIQSLDLEAKSPDWEGEGTTNADVTIYKLKGAKKAGKYYRVIAYDGCGISKESNRVQIKADGYTNVDSTTVVQSDMPTDVSITRIAPSVWELSWKYSETKDDPNRKFIIQTSKLKDFKWTGLKSPIEGNVRHYYIEGRDKIETYYRLAVVNSGDTSAFTEAVQLTPDIEYRKYMSPEIPAPSPRITMTYITGIDRDDDPETDDSTIVRAVGTYTIMNNVSKYIVESEYTDTVYYEARWFTSYEKYNNYKEDCKGKQTVDACDSCYWTETFPYQEPSISKRFDAMEDFQDAARKTTYYEYCYDNSGSEKNFAYCLESYVRKLCGYYVQFRLVWKDNINGKGKGATDWSEWTEPYSVADISGADKICNSN
ncbi:fibronectin type III domain-containing protein [Fibrobacter sp. UWB12]|uniref:fibronectin type III domain-containing protein n=1 Tax=Fibrobacter sp. UWB12 TaxID=1896203 RepID=UPI00092095A4|nr:fibronectin type III domain-containing protein [Fibrobacter sp. UWB12]SHK28868.1 hypothetical protein SAMN05720759_101520 [Fibrobacter sp. UWB12]